jgi:hypothetical protein
MRVEPSSHPGPRSLFGLAAEFSSPQAVLEAARRIRAAGYTRAEAYSPFPVEGLSQELGFGRTKVAMMALIGAIAGALGGYWMQWYANVISYPWNIGGEPPNSWPAFIPITFELGVLGAALAAVMGMLALCGLPQPYHPMFNLPQFSLASRDRFYLCIEATDPKFDLEATRRLLEELHPTTVAEVPQ